MSIDKAEKISNLLNRYRVLVVLMTSTFKKFDFYCEKRFRGIALNNSIALLPSSETALAFTIVAERKGHDLLLLKLGEGLYILFIAKCSNRRFIFNNMLIRVFKRSGVVIPRTLRFYTPIAIFRTDSWTEFEHYELSAIKEYCSDYAYMQAIPMRRKDFEQISRLKTVIENSRELMEVVKKSGSNINKIFNQLLG